METRDRHGSLPSLAKGTRLSIVYRNKKGEVTGRSIRVLSVSGGWPVYIRAFCELKGEERTFRGDRIIAWSILETAAGSPPLCPGEPRPAPKRKKRKWPALLAAGLIVWGIARFHDELPNLFLEADPEYTETAHITSTHDAFDQTRESREAPGTGPEHQAEVKEVSAEGTPERNEPDVYRELLLKRAGSFIEASGISDPELLTVYAAADTDGDGGLSWRELEVFQELVFGTFIYADNPRALSPDEFLSAGEGDCDDFALFTAGLVRFWGGLPYIGVIRGGDRTIGHAVCLVYTPDEPEYPVFWTNDGSAVYPGIDLPAGYFVPVDYEYVGSLSNAVSEGWTLAEIMIPEEIYDLPL